MNIHCRIYTCQYAYSCLQFLQECLAIVQHDICIATFLIRDILQSDTQYVCTVVLFVGMPSAAVNV